MVSEVKCSLFRVSNETKVRNVDVRYANDLASQASGRLALAYNGTYSAHMPDMCDRNTEEGHAYSEGYKF